MAFREKICWYRCMPFMSIHVPNRGYYRNDNILPPPPPLFVFIAALVGLYSECVSACCCCSFFMHIIIILLDFDSCRRCESMWRSAGLSTRLAIWRGKNVHVAIFVDTECNSVKLCMMIDLIAFYLFIPRSVAFVTFRGHNSIRRFQIF